MEDSDSPTGSSEPLITVEHLDSLIERHPLSSVGMPELGIIVGGIVGIWTFVELFGFSE